VNVFHQRRLPESATPAGYGALIDAYDLDVPAPIRLSATGRRHRVIDTADWLIMTPRHQPHCSWWLHASECRTSAAEETSCRRKRRTAWDILWCSSGFGCILPRTA